MSRRRRQSGFTLLELIVATAMVAILALTLYGSMSIGFRARVSAENQVRAMREASIAMDLVQQDLQSVPPPRGILAGPFIGYAMGSAGAEADSLEFHALGRDMGDVSEPLSDGLRRIQLLLLNDGDSSVLVRRVERNLLAPIRQDPAEELLARNVRAFSVRYFDGYGWLQEWDSTVRDNTLPVAVEVMIELDLPSPGDQSRPYRISQFIPLACGRMTEPEDLLGELLE